MNAALWIALAFAGGSAGTLAAMRPVLKQRYQRGKADGFLDGYDAGERNMERAADAAYQRGNVDGFMQLGRDLMRDIGPDETQRMLERMAAMDKAEEAMKGKRT
jgi:hypothetical protein